MMTLLAHWHELGVIGLVVAALAAVQVFLPGVLPAVLRFILGTEWGRALLVIAAVGLGWWWFRDHYIAVGRADLLAEQHAAASSAQVHASQQVVSRDLSAESIGDQTQAQTAGHIEQSKAATAAAVERTRGRIEAVPAVSGCAGPDPGVVRDVQASSARVRAAENRMRGIGATTGHR